MQQDEIYAKIADIDYILSTKDEPLSVCERITELEKQLCPDLNDLKNRFFTTLNSEEFDKVISTISIYHWYLENYGYKQTPDYLIIKETPFFLQGEIWYFTHPENPEYHDIVDCTNLPKIVKQKLTQLDIEHLKHSFKCSRRKLQAIKDLDDVVLHRDKKGENEPDIRFLIPEELKNNFFLDNETIKFIRFAIEDLNLAIVTSKSTRDYQFVIFPASQAIEKLLKACIFSEDKILNKEVSELVKTMKHQYGHNLLKIIKDYNKVFTSADEIESQIHRFPNAEKIFEGGSVSNLRYEVMDVSPSPIEAFSIIDATLNIFELVSGHFVTPLHRVMHNYEPELEEYDAELEDNDYFLEE